MYDTSKPYRVFRRQAGLGSRSMLLRFSCLRRRPLLPSFVCVGLSSGWKERVMGRKMENLCCWKKLSTVRS